MFALGEREESEIYFDVGRKLVEDEKFEEAIASFRKVLRTRPDHAEALFELGMLHSRQGAHLAAITMLEQAKAAGCSERKLHMLLADALCREERFEEAIKELDAVIKMKSDVADVHYRRALLLDRLGRHDDAVVAFEKAIRLAPREIRYHHGLGFTLETMGRRTDAIQCFKRALEVERPKRWPSEHEHD
jgi:tetratricopeptide (TPR) repeat protein